MYDYTALHVLMKNKGYTQKSLAKALGMAKSTMSLKFNGHRFWHQDEIGKCAEILGISPAHIGTYFFALNVPHRGTNAREN